MSLHRGFEGSSPHTRGAPQSSLPRHAACWDHPRIRGEHRGFEVHAFRDLWIIPAYAGSTGFDTANAEAMGGSSPHTRGAQSCSTTRTRCTRDHPRIRGEHAVVAHWCATQGGIIPAYAGSTSP